MKITKVTVKVETDKGVARIFTLGETAQAVKNDKTGKTSLAHYQPANDSKVVKGFSKLYIDTQELSKAGKAES